ncbi:MAG: STAS domain-containing protein [Nocardioides sp.]
MLERTFATALAADGVLTVRGEVDDFGVIALRNLLAEHASEPGSQLVVDLTEVDHLPSVAVGVLTRALAKAIREGASLELVAARGSVAQRVLMICALPYHESLEDLGGEDDDPPDAGVPA